MNEHVYKEQLDKIYNDFSSQVMSLRTEIDGLNTIITDMHEHEALLSYAPHVSRHLNETTSPSDAIDSGDTAWMLTSCTLVLMMTIPGLILFYSGMIRTKNVLTTVMQVDV